jgi:hypothetical protein
MELSSEISQVKSLNARAAYKYIRKATYGLNTLNDLLELSQVHILKRRLEWNNDRVLKTKATAKMLEGQKVSYSSLSEQNNNLFLDTSNKCYDLEYLNCLSETETCKTIEKVNSLCNKI